MGFAFHSRSVPLTLPEKLLVFTAIPALLALPHPSGSMENGSSSGKDAQEPTIFHSSVASLFISLLLYFPSPEMVVFEYFFSVTVILVGRRAADLFSLPVVLLFYQVWVFNVQLLIVSVFFSVFYFEKLHNL